MCTPTIELEKRASEGIDEMNGHYGAHFRQTMRNNMGQGHGSDLYDNNHEENEG